MASATVSTLNRSEPVSDSHVADAMLIKGQFDSRQAKAQLLGILNKSIQHHWVQSFKQHESSNQSDTYADSKMVELSTLREDFLKMLDIAEKNGLRLDIEASLKVSIAPEKTPEQIAS